jgi:hypothetical protein
MSAPSTLTLALEERLRFRLLALLRDGETALAAAEKGAGGDRALAAVVVASFSSGTAMAGSA